MFEIFINNIGYNNSLDTVKEINNKHQCILILFKYFHEQKVKMNNVRKYGKMYWLSLFEFEKKLIEYVFSNEVCFEFQDEYKKIKVVVLKLEN